MKYRDDYNISAGMTDFLVGFISKEMFHSQALWLQSVANLKVYELPLRSIGEQDIGRKVYVQNGKIRLESIARKNQRLQALFLIEKSENRPIVNIDVEGEYIEPKLELEPQEMN